MASNPAVPFWDPADTVTCVAKSAVTGKRFVTIDGPAHADGNPSVSHQASAADNVTFGVSGYDAAAGAGVSVYCRGQVMPVTAAAAISAGDLVFSTADGKATATPVADARPAGQAVDDAIAGADAPIHLI